MLKQVLVISEQPLSGESIRHALRHARGCRVATRVDGTTPCTAPVGDLRPDLILVDEMRSRAVMLARIREARAAAPAARIVLVTGDLGADNLADAIEAGADAAIGRNMDALTFAMLVSAIAAGQIYHAFTAAPRRAQTGGGGLTARELQVLEMVTAGASNGRIAKALWVTEQTVKYHLSNIYRKLGVSNRTQASYYAHVNGLFQHGAPMRARTATTEGIAA
jgi:DNA-binding NarL/FixJ family response regulator